VAKRKVGGHAQRLGAEVFGLVDAPKPRRRAPVFAAGVVTGAGATYLLTRQRRD
jgi:hypothetical protein